MTAIFFVEAWLPIVDWGATSTVIEIDIDSGTVSCVGLPNQYGKVRLLTEGTCRKIFLGIVCQNCRYSPIVKNCQTFNLTGINQKLTSYGVYPDIRKPGVENDLIFCRVHCVSLFTLTFEGQLTRTNLNTILRCCFREND